MSSENGVLGVGASATGKQGCVYVPRCRSERRQEKGQSKASFGLHAEQKQVHR